MPSVSFMCSLNIQVVLTKQHKDNPVNKKFRYAVMTEGNRTIYRGNSRFVAWTFWLINRHRKAIACDCGVWVVEPACWIHVARTEKSASAPDSIKA